MWVCLKQSPENMVLEGLLQIGAKDFTVCTAVFLGSVECISLVLFHGPKLLLSLELVISNMAWL